MAFYATSFIGKSTVRSVQTEIEEFEIPKGGNQNLYIEEVQTTQWPKKKVHKDKQRCTKHTYQTKDRVTRTPLKTGGEHRCPGRVSSSYSTRRVNLVINTVPKTRYFVMLGQHGYKAINRNVR